LVSAWPTGINKPRFAGWSKLWCGTPYIVNSDRPDETQEIRGAMDPRATDDKHPTATFVNTVPS